MQQPPQGYTSYPPQQGHGYPPQHGHGYPAGYPAPAQHGPAHHAPPGMHPGGAYPGPPPHGAYAGPGGPGHHAPAYDAAVAPTVVVVGSQYCFPHQVVFKLTEKVGWSGDSMDIVDGTGTLRYKLKGKAISFKDKRTLVDPAGNPILTMKQKTLTLRGSWYMMKGGSDSETQLAEIKPNMIQLMPGVKIYLNDGDKEADFSIKGELLAKKFEIFKRNGDEKKLIASVKKESKFSSSSAFFQSQVLEKQSYFLTVEPGVDTAFVVSLATLLDEMYHDQK